MRVKPFDQAVQHGAGPPVATMQIMVPTARLGVTQSVEGSLQEV
jgi:hypothetical protein